MRYLILFILLTAGMTTLALQHRGLAWLLLWPAAGFGAAALGYAWLGGRVTGKRPDGRIAPWGWAINGPYLLTTILIWHLERLLPENPWDEIAPNLWLGRRPLARELDGRIRWVVDLTAEMPVAAGVRQGRGYLLFATLDGHVMTPAELDRAVEQVAGLPEGVLIHCAVGHGRSAMLAAAVLVKRGLAVDVDQAMEILRRARPKVRPGRRQRAMLRRWQAQQQAQDPTEPCQSSSISNA